MQHLGRDTDNAMEAMERRLAALLERVATIRRASGHRQFTADEVKSMVGRAEQILRDAGVPQRMLPAVSSAQVARRVAQLRRDRGLSAAQLADRTMAAGAPGLNRSVLANIETGRRNFVTVDEVAVLARVLETHVLDLLSEN